jgi:Resolvase, N terminal domain
VLACPRCSASRTSRERAQRSGVVLKSYREPWLDTSSPALTELLLSMFGWIVRQEREQLIAGTRAGMARARSGKACTLDDRSSLSTGFRRGQHDLDAGRRVAGVLGYDHLHERRRPARARQRGRVPAARSRHRQYVSVRGLIRSRAANAAAVNPLLVHRATRAAHVARVSRAIGAASYTPPDRARQPRGPSNGYSPTQGLNLARADHLGDRAGQHLVRCVG